MSAPLQSLLVSDSKPERHGHPVFYKFIKDMGDLHDRKNYDYAVGGRPLGNFERVASIKSNYPDMDWASREGTALDYMLKQLDAYMWMKSQGHISKTGEGLLERLFDVGVYTGILYCMEDDNVHP